jgi:hypothetical protein
LLDSLVAKNIEIIAKFFKWLLLKAWVQNRPTIVKYWSGSAPMPFSINSSGINKLAKHLNESFDLFTEEINWRIHRRIECLQDEFLIDPVKPFTNVISEGSHGQDK